MFLYVFGARYKKDRERYVFSVFFMSIYDSKQRMKTRVYRELINFSFDMKQSFVKKRPILFLTQVLKPEGARPPRKQAC